MYKIRDFPYVSMRDEVFFPGSSCRLDLSQASSRDAARAAATSESRKLAIFTTTSTSPQVGLDDLYPVGVLALLHDTGEAEVFEAEVLERVQLRDLTQHPHPIAQVQLLTGPSDRPGEEQERTDGELRSLAHRLFERCGEKGRRAGSIVEEIEPGQPLELVYFLASSLQLRAPDALAILAARDIPSAQRRAVQALTALLAGLRPGQNPVRSVVWAGAPAHDEEDSDEESALRLRELIEELELAPDILERVLPELEKLDRFDPVLFEHQETLARLEGLLAYPWQLTSGKRPDPQRLQKELDRAILGHEGAKESLLDLSSVAGQKSLPLVILAGPAGLGKGSLIRALAAGLRRPLRRLRMPTEGAAEYLLGTARSLPGGAPGAVYEAALGAGVLDPVLHLSSDGPLDEAAASALLQLVDPDTNRRFPDAYLGLPIDVSRMLVVLDVRSAEMVPTSLRAGALLLSLEAYTAEQRLAILQDFLWPQAMRRCGLRDKSLRLEESVAHWLVNLRTREDGVLELSRLVDQMARRVARRKAAAHQGVEWSLAAARACLGEGDPLPDRSGAAVGVVGQAVLVASGAEVLESAALPRSQPGTVLPGAGLSESLRQALELALSLGPSPRRPGLSGWHLLAPGDKTLAEDHATLSLAVALALRSASLQRAVPRNLAVLGRLLPGGDIAPVAAARDRALAAWRAGYRVLLTPAAQAGALAEALPDEVRKALRVVPVASLEEAARRALPPGLDENSGNTAA